MENLLIVGSVYYGLEEGGGRREDGGVRREEGEGGREYQRWEGVEGNWHQDHSAVTMPVFIPPIF